MFFYENTFMAKIGHLGLKVIFHKKNYTIK